jgi:hypothetical protein
VVIQENPTVFSPSNLDCFTFSRGSFVPNFILKRMWLGSWGYNDVYKVNKDLGLAMLEEGVDDGATARKALERRGWDAAHFAQAVSEHNRDVKQAQAAAANKSKNDWPFP